MQLRMDFYLTNWHCPKIVKEIKVACLPHNLSPKSSYILYHLFFSALSSQVTQHKGIT